MEPLDLDGVRLHDGHYLGRVSHISGYRKPDKAAASQATLAKWREQWKLDNPELPDDFYSQRGTLFHSACEHRLIQGNDPSELHEWIAPFYKAARPILGNYSKVYWAEKPIDLELPWKDLEAMKFTTPEGEQRWQVFKKFWKGGDAPLFLYGFCGTPDLVCRWRGKVTLIDWKTSNKLYVPTRPRFSRGPDHNPAKEALRRQAINGWYKYERTMMQLSAYLVGLENHLALPDWIEQVCINVVTEMYGTQQLMLPRSVIVSKYWPQFLENLSNWQNEMTERIAAVA